MFCFVFLLFREKERRGAFVKRDREICFAHFQKMKNGHPENQHFKFFHYATIIRIWLWKEYTTKSPNWQGPSPVSKHFRCKCKLILGLVRRVFFRLSKFGIFLSYRKKTGSVIRSHTCCQKCLLSWNPVEWRMLKY